MTIFFIENSLILERAFADSEYKYPHFRTLSLQVKEVSMISPIVPALCYPRFPGIDEI